MVFVFSNERKTYEKSDDSIHRGEEALNRLAEERFDAVISDVEMPGMSGFELLQQVHLRCPHVPVILMTAFYEDETRELAVAWGAKALLRKPFSGEEVAVALHLTRRNSRWPAALTA